MDWLILVVAGLFEIGWAVGLKSSDGLTKFWPTVWTLIALAASMGLLALALKTLPLGTAYTVWTGIGAIGTVVLGILWFGESASPLRLACITLILVGIIGLKLATPAKAEAVGAQAAQLD